MTISVGCECMGLFESIPNCLRHFYVKST